MLRQHKTYDAPVTYKNKAGGIEVPQAGTHEACFYTPFFNKRSVITCVLQGFYQPCLVLPRIPEVLLWVV